MKFAIALLVLALPLSSQELCTGGACTANTATEFNSATASDNSSQAFKVTSTLPAVGNTVFGTYFALTGSGSGSGDQRGVVARLFPGHTGGGITTAFQALDQSAGTGQIAVGAINGSVGAFAAAIGATVGSKTGIYAFGVDSSTANYGGILIGDGGALNMGLAGVAGGAGSPSARVGLYGGYGSFPAGGFTNAAILADNVNATSLPLIVARQNGAKVFEVPAGGGVQLIDQGTKPTCDAAHRGLLWYDAGASGVADTFEKCLKDSSDSYAWTP